jgi:hypothetical protein
MAKKKRATAADDVEVLVYHKRCRKLCERLGVQLVGFTNGAGFSYNLPDDPINAAYGNHQIPQTMMEILERALRLDLGDPTPFAYSTEESSKLYQRCVDLGANPISTIAWPDRLRKAFIDSRKPRRPFQKPLRTRRAKKLARSR